MAHQVGGLYIFTYIMLAKRAGTATWTGRLKDGTGTLTTESGALDKLPYSYKARFENAHGEAGSNPEELLAAAHAGCFTMSLSQIITKMGFEVNDLKTVATVLMEDDPKHLAVLGVQLVVNGKIPNMLPDQFIEAAEKAKVNCLMSKVINVPITMFAELN